MEKLELVSYMLAIKLERVYLNMVLVLGHLAMDKKSQAVNICCNSTRYSLIEYGTSYQSDLDVGLIIFSSMNFVY